MESATLAAIISGTAAIGSPLITLAATRIYDNRKLIAVKGSRRQAIVGTWLGRSKQKHDGIDLETDVKLMITAGKKLIEGEAHFAGPITGRPTHVRFAGGFLYEQFVKLDYSNVEEHALQFGTVILLLSPDARVLEGRFVGFGAETRAIVSGMLKCVKAA